MSRGRRTNGDSSPSRGLRRASTLFRPRAAALLLAAAAFLPGSAEAAGRVLRVPSDHELIGAAVAASRDGDTILVGDGFYFEKNLVLDKRVTLRSERLFGAVIVGSEEAGSSILIVRAPVLIEGFIFKGGYHGILQRDSPNVEWRGRDLAFLGVVSAVNINDRETTVGSAVLSNVIVDSAESGLTTNDACGLEARRIFISRSLQAFGGSNHRRFRVDDVVLLDCRTPLGIDNHRNALIEKGFIEAGPDFDVYTKAGLGAEGRSLRRRLGTLFYDDVGMVDSADRTRRRQALISLLLAEEFADAGRWDLASRHHLQALSIALACGLEEVRWRADFGLARAAEATGDPDTAVDYYKKTIAVFEASGLSLALTNIRAGYFRDKAPVYERLVRLLVRAHVRRPQAGLCRSRYMVDTSRSLIWGYAPPKSGFLRIRPAPSGCGRLASRAQPALQGSVRPAEVVRLLPSAPERPPNLPSLLYLTEHLL